MSIEDQWYRDGLRLHEKIKVIESDRDRYKGALVKASLNPHKWQEIINEALQKESGKED